MKSKLGAAAYCRVSTDKDDQINSLTSQIKYFTEYINCQNGWSLCEVYYDEGISGTSIKKRSGFNRMISDAEAHKIDLILTKEVSRFARNTVDTLSYTRRLKELGVGVLFMTDNIDTRDKDGELRLTIMASIAQEESRKTSERVKWGQKRRMEQGVVFGRDMLGYSVNKGKLTINPEEAETVRLIFNKYVIEGKGTHIIARELGEAGIMPKRAAEWSSTAILRTLRNEKYAGDLRQKKTFTPDYLSHCKRYNRGQEDMVYLKDHHEPIVERELWEKAQAKLKRPSPSDEQKFANLNRYWCSGKLICGECGQHFVSRTKKLKSGEVYRAWRCYALAAHGKRKTNKMGNKIGCDSSLINDRVLIACVSAVLRQVAIRKDAIFRELTQETRAVRELDGKIDTPLIYSKIEELKDKKRRAIDLLLDGTISKEDFRRQCAFYDSEIESLCAKIADAENIDSIRRQQTQGIESCLSEIRRFMSFNFENTLMLREAVDRIIISSGNNVTVYLLSLPFGVRLHYRTRGKLENFNVSFDEMEITNSPV